MKNIMMATVAVLLMTTSSVYAVNTGNGNNNGTTNSGNTNGTGAGNVPPHSPPMPVPYPQPQPSGNGVSHTNTVDDVFGNKHTHVSSECAVYGVPDLMCY